MISNKFLWLFIQLDLWLMGRIEGLTPKVTIYLSIYKFASDKLHKKRAYPFCLYDYLIWDSEVNSSLLTQKFVSCQNNCGARTCWSHCWKKSSSVDIPKISLLGAFYNPTTMQILYSWMSTRMSWTF